ncbi:MAG: nucleotidyltransferase domain-containing protein [Deltaproteobacteria bacterium]|nr:nucleotidyltransferase domain-containing protein [Deltaproteobacteria bacterium]
MNIIVKMKFGAHLYGTATSDSDIDYKGIFMPSKDEVLLGRIPKSQSHSTGKDESKNTKDDIDVEIYSFHYFIKLACDGQTVAMDMLHAPEEMILQSSDIWKAIIKNRHKFYTKNLKSFIDYTRRQASKYGIKGSRINAALQVLELLKREDPSKKMREIWDELPRIEHCYDIGPDPNGMRQYQVCGKSFQESATIGYVIPILEKFYNDYGRRARLAAKNRNIDWKAVSHALRAAYQTREILTENSLTFPLKMAPYLMKVKKGELDYLTEVAPVLESLMEEVEELSLSSSLPETVDRKFWDQFICDAVESKIFS